jgi:hypothetical protein
MAVLVFCAPAAAQSGSGEVDLGSGLLSTGNGIILSGGTIAITGGGAVSLGNISLGPITTIGGIAMTEPVVLQWDSFTISGNIVAAAGTGPDEVFLSGPIVIDDPIAANGVLFLQNNAIPQPATAALLGGGVLGLAVALRRRRSTVG